MPRKFSSGSHGYSNAALGTTGIAIAFNTAASGCIIGVSAPCFLGFRNSATLIAFNDTNYGTIMQASSLQFSRMRDGSATHIHIAPLTGTAIVSVIFI